MVITSESIKVLMVGGDCLAVQKKVMQLSEIKYAHNRCHTVIDLGIKRGLCE